MACSPGTSPRDSSAVRPCRVCAAPSEVFYVREGVPVLQNILFDTEREARMSPVGRLELSACSRCGFVSNEAFDGVLASYDARYENDQMRSPTFADHARRMARRVVDAMGPDGLLEIGCGQGGFITLMAGMIGRDAGPIVGFDPAARCDAVSGIPIVQRMFDAEAARDLAFSPGVVVVRHVIEHIPDPVPFLERVRAAITPGSRIFVETPCVSWILRHDAVHDLFHEHCSYFSAVSLTAALHASGFGDVRVDHVFSGDYLWAEAVAGRASAERTGDGSLLASARTFAARADEVGARWRRELASLPPARALWGAGAKGVTFATTIDPDRARVELLVDRNPQKQGRYVPVSGHPVLSPAAAAAAGLGAVVVMNAAYAGEVDAELLALGVAPVRLVV